MSPLSKCSCRAPVARRFWTCWSEIPMFRTLVSLYQRQWRLAVFTLHHTPDATENGCRASIGTYECTPRLSFHHRFDGWPTLDSTAKSRRCQTARSGPEGEPIIWDLKQSVSQTSAASRHSHRKSNRVVESTSPIWVVFLQLPHRRNPLSPRPQPSHTRRWSVCSVRIPSMMP